MIDNRQHDDAFVQQLGQLGLDLKCPQAVEHFFFFPKPDRAELTAIELRSYGYAAEVLPQPVHGVWSVVARGQLLPQSEVISKTRSRMEQLAATFAGEYDGGCIPRRE